jgi:hypothetical protein
MSLLGNAVYLTMMGRGFLYDRCKYHTLNVNDQRFEKERDNNNL